MVYRLVCDYLNFFQIKIFHSTTLKEDVHKDRGSYPEFFFFFLHLAESFKFLTPEC